MGLVCMAQQKKGFIARMLEGKERSEEYARSTLPTNRWQLFWDIFKGNFGKIVTVNLLTILFFIPMIAVIVICVLLKNGLGESGPYSANVLGPAVGPLFGVAQQTNVQISFYLYAGILISSLIASVGLSGGMYVIRNMVWTEGIFVANDFWRGVKLNYKNALQTALFFCLILLSTMMTIHLAEWQIEIERFNLAESGGGKWNFMIVMFRISQFTSGGFLFLAAIMSLWMIALGVNYQMKFFVLFRNAFLMSVGTLPQTIFFGAIALAPFLLCFINISMIIIVACLLILVFGLSYALLVWLDFAQWVFDKYLNPKIEGAKVGRGIYKKDGSSESDNPMGNSGASLEYQRILLSHGRSRLIARPIKPIDDSLQVYELPQSFTREDLKKLRESKQNIAEDTETYAEEHKNDLRYVEYNRQFDEREKALQAETDKKGRKKKLKPPKMLGQ